MRIQHSKYSETMEWIIRYASILYYKVGLFAMTTLTWFWKAIAYSWVNSRGPS